MVSHSEGGLLSLMKRSWMKKMKKKRNKLPQPTTTSSKTAVCLCGRRCWNRPLGAVTLALFTLAGAFKDTRRRQRQQLYLSLHGDGVLLTWNFPGSLPDEVVGSTSLPHSICFHSTHGSAETQERETNRQTEWERGAMRGERKKKKTKQLPEWNCKSQEDRRIGLQMREREKWEMRM